jgi:RimJ/RimL family protein N-acetyltransferase
MSRAGPGSEDPHSALSFETAKAGLCLRSLTGADAPVLRELVLRNSRHLTRHGDYRELMHMSADSLADELSKRDGRTWRFGIFLDHSLIGRVDLIGVEPPRYSVGYWLSEHAAGQGNASASLRAVIAFARSGLVASDIYAGVTHGNTPSQNLLRRLGFTPVATFPDYRRFHLPLSRDMIGPTA